MKDQASREWFFSQKKIPFEVKRENPHFNVYTLESSGQTIGEITLDLGVGEEVTLGLTADLHISLCTMEDRADEELSYTEQCRAWLRYAESLPSAIKALEAADYTDASINLGDTNDYQSEGAMLLVKRNIFDRYPDIMIAPGGHDITLQMQTGRPDLRSLEERYERIRKIWPHPTSYYSRAVKGKVLCAVLDNCQSRFLPEQLPLLQADIERARAEGMPMLLFMHEPIAPRNSEYETLCSNISNRGAKDTVRVYGEKTGLVGAPESDETTLAVYNLITTSADVIRAVFTGHWHSQFYAEICATGKDGERTVIPEYVVSGSPYFKNGYMARVIIK